MEEQIVKLYVLSTFGLIGGMGVALACLVGVGRGVGYEKARLVESSHGDPLSSNGVLAVFMPKGVSRQATLYFKGACVFSSSAFMASSAPQPTRKKAGRQAAHSMVGVPPHSPWQAIFRKGICVRVCISRSFVPCLGGSFICCFVCSL